MLDTTNEQSIFEYLVHAILMLQTPDECRSFLHDLCTESELQEMGTVYMDPETGKYYVVEGE